MQFQVKIVLISFISTVILGLIAIPILKRFKIGQIERDDGPKTHLKKEGTPTMGGIIIAIATIAISILAYLDYYKTEPKIANNLIPLVLVALGFGLIGFFDDFKKLILKNTKGLSPKAKVIGLLIISVGFVLYLIKGVGIGTDTYIPFLKIFVTIPIWVYIPVAIFIIIGTTNAVNLTDGVDGLSTSVATIIITCLTVIGIILDVKEIAIFGSIVAGTCLGFLMFNLHPAKVFMGDTGSLLLGGVIVGMALYLKMPLILLIIALIPMIETLSVIIQVAYFKKTGDRIFKMAPLHHHFELSGWKENRIVSVFSIITLILCLIGLKAI